MSISHVYQTKYRCDVCRRIEVVDRFGEPTPHGDDHMRPEGWLKVGEGLDTLNDVCSSECGRRWFDQRDKRIAALAEFAAKTA